MLYRANLARRLPMERVGENWDRAQVWTPGTAMKEQLPATEHAA